MVLGDGGRKGWREEGWALKFIQFSKEVDT